MPDVSTTFPVSARTASDLAALLPHPLWVAAPNGAFTFVSARWTEQTGQPEDAALGAGWLAVVTPTEQSLVRTLFGRRIGAGAAFSLELTLAGADGPVAGRLYARPHGGSDGAPAGWVGTLVPERLAAPAADAGRRPDEASALSAAALPAPGTGRHSILVVEDNREARFLLRRILTRDYDVVCAGTFDGALSSARAHVFDAVLIDIHLNDEMSGTMLLEEIKQLPGYEKTRTAAVTAYGLPGDQDRFLRAGFERIIVKPFMSSEILALVEDLLGEPAATD